jgi:hypothetical protein
MRKFAIVEMWNYENEMYNLINNFQLSFEPCALSLKPKK